MKIKIVKMEMNTRNSGLIVKNLEISGLEGLRL